MPLAVAVLCVTHVVIGWRWGYQYVFAYVLFWLLAALAAGASRIVVARAFGVRRDAESLLRVSVVMFAIVVLCGLALGSIGRLSPPGYAAAQIALWLGAWSVDGTAPGDVRVVADSGRCSPWLAGVFGAMASFAIAFALGHAPLTLYDSVSYHLFFASRWVQEGVLSIVPTPFSDVAQAYAPANGELYFAWLMTPFHGDLLARFGQLPFAAVGAVALYLLARRLGARPPHALYPAAFFALSRPVLEQAVGANVDLICAATFVTSLYFGLVAVERDDTRDWMFFGLSLGLYAGTKYLALVYLPVLLAVALLRRPSPRLVWALPGLVLCAGPWYLRNWIVAGSPIYPASLTVAGVTLARGAFTRAAMLNTVFHATDLRLWPTIAARAFGPTLFPVWIPVALVGGIRLARRGWWPFGCVAVLPFAMAPLYWFGLPVNVDARFLLPAIGPALLPFAFTFGESKRWNAAVHAFYAVAILWILLGTGRQIRPAVPWFMAGWWSFEGLVDRRFIGWFAALATAIALVWRIGGRYRFALPATVCAVVAAAAVLAMSAESWCVPSRCDYLRTTSPYIRPNLILAWRWVDQNLKSATIAYTGINLPYPLTGQRLTNRVVYVNIDGHPDWRFHDYDHASRDGLLAPPDPPLAVSSGELLPVAAGAGPRDALRPRYDRMAGVKAAWIGNLQVLGVTHVFVAALSPYEIDYVWHNDRALPIEDEWAASEPRLFSLVYDNPQVRVYAVNLPAKARA